MKNINKQFVFDKALELASDTGSYVLKLVVFRDDKKRGYASESEDSHFFMVINSYNKKNISKKLTKSSVVLSRQKKLAGIKHLNRLEQVLAAQEITDSNYSDAIMCNDSGHIIETINKNIILFKKDKIYSPKLNESGIYGVALRWLQSQGHEIIWKKIEFNDLAQYHGMMICNSIQGFKSIKNIGNNISFNKKNKMAKIIKSQWRTTC